jgi:acyl-CoA thioester hydrolase
MCDTMRGDTHAALPCSPVELLTHVEHEIEIDVRYYETDGQGVVHHANYFVYFEQARVAMLKAMGHDYADLERDGVFLVVHSIACKYHRPARFGDRLRIQTRVVKATMARIEHGYKVFVGSSLIAEASSTIACVDREGNIRRMPEHIVRED